MPKSRKRRQQFATLPFRRAGDGVEVPLVTSRGTGRWVLPKGWPMEGKRPHRAAEIEAYEEAGVVGKALKKAVGHYDYMKVGVIPYRVVLFALPVDQVLDAWPEDGERQREWVSASEGSERVSEPELRSILSGFSPATARAPRKVRKQKRVLKGDDRVGTHVVDTIA